MILQLKSLVSKSFDQKASFSSEAIIQLEKSFRGGALWRKVSVARDEPGGNRKRILNINAQPIDRINKTITGRIIKRFTLVLTFRL